MPSGKKAKKKWQKTQDLVDFLDVRGTTPTVPIKPLSWADDVEDDHHEQAWAMQARGTDLAATPLREGEQPLLTFSAREGEKQPHLFHKPASPRPGIEHNRTYTSRSSKEPVVLPTAPRAARDPRGMDDDVPTSPPFVASLSNLPYDVDEDYLTEFFADMKIVNIRLPKDSTKLKGYGYIEFEDRQSLIDALNLPNTSMKTRRVRIDVMNSSNDDRRGGRMGRDNRRDGYDDPERTSGDWRSGPRDSPADGDSYRSRYDNRDRDRRDDREASDFDNNKPGGWRENTDRGRPMMRDRGGFRDDDKDREWSRYDRGSRDRDGDRRSNFGPRRNYGEAEYDRDGARKQTKLPPAMDSKSDSRSRPKLQLQPRTKPVEAGADQPIKDDSPSAPATASAPAAAPTPPPASTPAPARASSPTPAPAPALAPAPTPASAHAPASAPSTNIFGAARPVDTAAREREIEERLAKLNSESKFRDERDGDPEKRGKEGTWGRRNGEGRDDKEKERGRLAWRTEDDRGRRNERSAPQSQPAHSDQYADSRGPPSFRSGPPLPKGPQRSNDIRGSDRDRKDREKDDASRMSKTKDDQAPNFVASNKYSMLPDDVDPDNIDD